MKFAIETVAETQKTTLAAAGAFAESVLVVTERAMLLNIELTRSACEQSAAMTKAWTTSARVTPMPSNAL